MRVIVKELLPYTSAGEQSSLFTAARLLHPYYIVVGIYSLVLVAAGLPLATYFDAQHQPQLHVLLCVALWVVGTVCVLRCCQFSWRLLMTRGEWWNLWRRQAGTLGVRFVVLASSLPLALGLIALYCQWRHAQHMAENGPRWHGALFSCALAVPRVIYEIMITMLVTQVFPATRRWSNMLSASQMQAAMDLIHWQVLASSHNITLAALHDSHAHYIGLYFSQPEYLLLVYNCLLLIWALVLLMYLVGSTHVRGVSMHSQVSVDKEDLVPGVDMVINMNVYPPPIACLVDGTVPWLQAKNVPVVGTPEATGGDYAEGPPSHVMARARRHSHMLLHKHFRFHHREFI